jgi:putative spermidine/putrescine transport system permease protein
LDQLASGRQPVSQAFRRVAKLAAEVVAGRGGVATLLLLPALLLVGMVFLAPFLWLGVMSLRRQTSGSLLMADGFYWGNYARLINDQFFARATLRTFLYSVVATALSLLAGLPVARLIASGAGKVKGLLLALMLAPLVSGALLPALGMMQLLGPLGVVHGGLRMLGLGSVRIAILGTPTGVVLGLVQAFLPLMVLPLVAVLSRLPRDVEAAAASLGAPPWAVWRHVLLPLAAPGIRSGCALVFCGCFTAFVTPQVLGQGRIATFGTVAYQQAALVLDWPLASALAIGTLALLGLMLALARGAMGLVTR